MALFFLQWMNKFWKKHYEDLFHSFEEAKAQAEDENEKRRYNLNRNITAEPSSIVEVTASIIWLKLNKAASTDGICSDLFKYGAKEIDSALRPLLLEVEKTNKIPSVWKSQRKETSVTARTGEASLFKHCN